MWRELFFRCVVGSSRERISLCVGMVLLLLVGKKGVEEVGEFIG